MLHLLRGEGDHRPALHRTPARTQHCFCATCTQRYIIEQEEHKCPTCRTEFAGSRDTIKRSFYELIEEDREVFEEARGIVLEMLGKYNTRVVRALAHQQSK